MQENQEKIQFQRTDWWKIIGLVLLISGSTLFIETQLRTGWLYYLPFLALAGISIFTGLKRRQRTFLLLGLGMLSTCLILFVIFSTTLNEILVVIGFACAVIGFCWFAYIPLAKKIRGDVEYWALLVAGVFLGLGVSFLWRQAQFIDFVLWVSIGVSVPMLIWGYAKQYFGLLITGCIIFSSGVGVAIAWGTPDIEINSLTRTGVMLIAFSLGWGGISVFSKRFYEKIVWWPLIPAGVLCMSGGGLFIGGGVGSTSQYVGNTLSITLIILGIYVLLLRSGFNKK